MLQKRESKIFHFKRTYLTNGIMYMITTIIWQIVQTKTGHPFYPKKEKKLRVIEKHEYLVIFVTIILYLN